LTNGIWVVSRHDIMQQEVEDYHSQLASRASERG